MTRTNVEMFNEILSTYALSEEHKRFLEAKRDAVIRANERKSTSMTPQQKLNADTKVDIVAKMEDGRPYTVTDLIGAFGNAISCQRLSALLNQLVEDGFVTKGVVKRQTYYTKVAVEA